MSRHGMAEAGQGHPRHGLSPREGSRVSRAGGRPVTAKQGAMA